ncbi:hypothetical protein PM10SUCC1_36950 [Propionigenium maris DSM 9537]|uniref:Uncharacterized protein n=1 Tax=Propionigenium maris DSM 9537 TaxID=1123000 RepID=A0A9W6GQ67_9FUSO|nr:hypothetical protein [Propionigenium maris]GLI58181.1 hypothetical protein PM10SUCC1_36950 [Propionigenium maris DSM 9537]
MLAEVFSNYQDAVSGLFIFLCTHNEEKGFTAPQVQFDEELLLNGVEFYTFVSQKLNLM